MCYCIINNLYETLKGLECILAEALIETIEGSNLKLEKRTKIYKGSQMAPGITVYLYCINHPRLEQIRDSTMISYIRICTYKCQHHVCDQLNHIGDKSTLAMGKQHNTMQHLVYEQLNHIKHNFSLVMGNQHKTSYQ